MAARFGTEASDNVASRKASDGRDGNDAPLSREREGLRPSPPGGPLQRVHFIGVGGVSMSALAVAAQARGLVVTGSDARRSARSERLSAHGIAVQIGHRVDNVGAADTVVYSTDVPADNPERRVAAARGLRLWHRAEMLAWLMAGRRALLVTGTHGKTTTTAMVAAIWKAAHESPTVLVGGDVPTLTGGNVELGDGAFLVAEADESDGSFRHYQPESLVLTNLEPEHLEHYAGSFDNVQASVADFAGRVAADGPGVVVWGADDPVLARMMPTVPAAQLSFGWAQPGRRLDFAADDIELAAMESRFSVIRGGERLATVALRVPGRHNVLNALAAFALAQHYGVAPTTAAEALAKFSGVRRRFDVRSQARGILLVDDYAVHPTEVAAVLTTARHSVPGRVLAILQPHRYARTALLWPEMLKALGHADGVAILPVYAPPGEPPRPEFTGERLAAAAAAAHPERRISYVETLEAAVAWAVECARPGDVVATLGAGDVWQVASRLAAAWADDGSTQPAAGESR